MDKYRVKKFIKIHEYCSKNCTFCSKTYNGDKSIVESYLKNDILSKISDNSIVHLIGINICDYQDDETDLIALIESILSKFKNCYIQLDNISLTYKNIHKLLELVNNEKMLSKTIHLPVQSCSNNVLKSMEVGHSLELVDEIINNKLYSNIFFALQFIIGFPGETDEQFKTTLDYCLKWEKRNNIFFDFNSYFEDEHTPSINFSNKVDEKIKQERMLALQVIENKTNPEFKTFCSLDFVGIKIL